MKKTAVIIGAGPAGLTAAYELLTKTDIVPVIIEADNQVGGFQKLLITKAIRLILVVTVFFPNQKG